jgi:hypothetical protein
MNWFDPVAAATAREVLIALDCDGGEPQFHELEPHPRLAGTTRRA